MRQVEQQYVEQQFEPDQSIPIPINDNRDEAATGCASAEKKVDLKKQSQSVPAQAGAKSYVKGYYDNNPVQGIEENKPNSKPNKSKQSQFRTRVALEGDQSIHCSGKIQG